MTSNDVLQKRSFLSTPPPFNGDRFKLLKARFKTFIQCFKFESWETITNGPFIPTYHINGEVVDKPDFLWTIKEKIKFEIDLKINNFLVVSLDDN